MPALAERFSVLCLSSTHICTCVCVCIYIYIYIYIYTHTHICTYEIQILLCRGRKKGLWLSVSADLIYDATRDLRVRMMTMICVYIPIYAYIHTYIHTYTHKYIHIHNTYLIYDATRDLQVRMMMMMIHACVFECVCADTYTHTYIYMRAHT